MASLQVANPQLPRWPWEEQVNHWCAEIKDRRELDSIQLAITQYK